MICKKLFKCLATTLAIASLSSAAFADECEPDGMISRYGAIEMNYSCGDIALSGAGISVYKVADATLTDNTIVYSFVDELSSFSSLNMFGRETFFDEMTAVESNKAAKDFAKTNLIKCCSGVTDSDGNISFDMVPIGMYLVTQTGSEGVSADYTTFDPFLLSVPLVDDETKDYVYSVHVVPKSEVNKIPETTTPSETVPETTTPGSPILGIEDNSEMLHSLFIGLAISCGLLFAALGVESLVVMNKNKKDE